MVITPWWMLALLVQFALIGALVAAFYFHKARKAETDRAASQERLQQQLALATEHKLKIAEMELQLESLEAFQEMYTELQEQHDALQALHKEFTDKTQELLSDEDQARLKETLQRLESEKARLEQKLQGVGEALQRILDQQHFAPTELEAAGEAARAAAAEVELEVQAIGSVIEQQQRLIERLSQQVGNLQVEVDAKQQLESTMAQLKQQNGEMAGVVSELKQHNRDLQEQVKAMAVKERADDNHHTAEFKRLQHALVEKDRAYKELFKQYTAIEAEYQKIYAKSRKIQA